MEPKSFSFSRSIFSLLSSISIRSATRPVAFTEATPLVPSNAGSSVSLAKPDRPMGSMSL